MKHTYRDDYLSDKELEELILQVEEREMISAPEYLEHKIVDRLRHQEQLVEYKTKISAGRKLLSYSLKVAAASAAAIAFLIIVPAVERESGISEDITVIETQQEQRQEDEREDKREPSLIQNINQKTNEFCGNLFRKSSAIFQKEDK